MIYTLSTILYAFAALSLLMCIGYLVSINFCASVSKTAHLKQEAAIYLQYFMYSVITAALLHGVSV